MCNLKRNFLAINKLLGHYAHHGHLSKKFYDIELIFQLVLCFSVKALQSGALSPRATTAPLPIRILAPGRPERIVQVK